MRRVLLLSVSLAAFSLSGCGSTSIGDECEGGGCGSELTCRADFPGTFCTQACTQEGESGGCPEDTLCIRPLGDQLLCAPVCQNHDDCREGYECNGVTGTSVKACRVKL